MDKLKTGELIRTIGGLFTIALGTTYFLANVNNWPRWTLAMGWAIIAVGIALLISGHHAWLPLVFRGDKSARTKDIAWRSRELVSREWWNIPDADSAVRLAKLLTTLRKVPDKFPGNLDLKTAVADFCNALEIAYDSRQNHEDPRKNLRDADDYYMKLVTSIDNALKRHAAETLVPPANPTRSDSFSTAQQTVAPQWVEEDALLGSWSVTKEGKSYQAKWIFRRDGKVIAKVAGCNEPYAGDWVFERSCVRMIWNALIPESQERCWDTFLRPILSQSAVGDSWEGPHCVQARKID